MKRWIKKSRYPLLFLLATASIVLWKESQKLPNGTFTMHFFDVGQGDATMVETPSGAKMLIDGGPPSAIVEQLGRVLPFWDRSIDVVVFTHPQLDHIGGLPDVFERYEVKRVIMAYAPYRLAAYEELLEIIEHQHIPVTLARPDVVIDFGDGVVAQILHPTNRAAERIVESDINETSVILRIAYGETSLLAVGDAGFETENALIASGAPIDADILKVGHHGSKYSSSLRFLKAVTPRITAIEVGRNNRYGHPTPEALDRLAAIGATVFRTDRDGTITIASDGHVVWRAADGACMLHIFCKQRPQILFSE